MTADRHGETAGRRTRIYAVVQARMSSERLPGKVLTLVRGKPMLSYLLDRLKQSQELDGVVVATSDQTSDDRIAAFAESADVGCYRGSLEDVASRLVAAAEMVEADALVRVSGDSPLLDSALVDTLVALYRKNDRVDLVTNVQKRTFPKGQSVEVVALASLRQIYESGLSIGEREHVTSHFYMHPDRFSIVNVEHDAKLGSVQLSIDTPSDMARFDSLLGVLGEPAHSHGLDAVLAAARQLEVAQV